MQLIPYAEIKPHDAITTQPEESKEKIISIAQNVKKTTLNSKILKIKSKYKDTIFW